MPSIFKDMHRIKWFVRGIIVFSLFVFLAVCSANELTNQPPNPVLVVSPAYCSDIKGDTLISLKAQGMRYGVVNCWQQGPGFGSNSLVGTIRFDSKGNGLFHFPADCYPHGPITLRITATDGHFMDACNLQLYNKGGVSWHEGLPKEVPPPAKGMKVIFADDFTSRLSISPDGVGTTYCSHKPGGGDFGLLHFADIGDTGNPFSQVDTYLRIRADTSKGTDGLISSIGMNGKGILASAPCYFECRFIAQSAPGSWPAFWLLTKSVSTGVPHIPADEYDVIEAYGGEGPHNPNAKGYMTTSHFWNQKPGQPGVSGEQEIFKLGGGSTWWQTFHTYGCKITKTYTIYYFDNIEVTRNPTSRLGKSDPFFFLINLAVGGNGWPVSLSRYSGKIDMYVDYVRVWKG